MSKDIFGSRNADDRATHERSFLDSIALDTLQAHTRGRLRASGCSILQGCKAAVTLAK